MHNKNIFLLLSSIFLLFSPALPAQDMASVYEGSQFAASTYQPVSLPFKDYKVNFSISHGHCQTPYEALFKEVQVRNLSPKMKDLKVDFEIHTQTLYALHEPDGPATERLLGSGYFDATQNPVISFKTKDTYFLGSNWVQINGNMEIRGTSVPVSFHVRAIGDGAGCNPQPKHLVLDGQVNLKDFGISSPNGAEQEVAEKIMSINLLVKADDC